MTNKTISLISFFTYPYRRMKSAYFCARNKYLTLYNPKKLADICYHKNFGGHIDWKHPQDMIEKQRWLMFNSDISLWSLLADKYRVRSYLEEKGWGNILVKQYGKWNKAEDISFESLPNSFVLKTNHGSGEIILVPDKSHADLELIRRKMAKYIRTPFGYGAAEIQYLSIVPCVFAEELLIQDGGLSSSLVDYKFYTFHGVPVACAIMFNRRYNLKGDMSYDTALYDANWNKINRETLDFPKPKTYNQMTKFCKEMCSQFPFVRMDFYEVNGKLYFGEFTFTPAALGKSHVISYELIKEWGSLMNISAKQIKA